MDAEQIGPQTERSGASVLDLWLQLGSKFFVKERGAVAALHNPGLGCSAGTEKET